MTGIGDPSTYGGMSRSTAEAVMRRRMHFQQGATGVAPPLPYTPATDYGNPKNQSVITMRPDLSGVGLGTTDSEHRRQYQGGWSRLMPTQMGMSESTYKQNAYKLMPYLPPDGGGA